MSNQICRFGRKKASVLMQRQSYPTETVLSNKITENRIVLSFQDSPRKPLRRRPKKEKGKLIKMAAQKAAQVAINVNHRKDTEPGMETPLLPTVY